MRIVACTIACLALVGGGLAGEPRIEKAGAKQRLSRVLPEHLSAFVTKTGADRDLTDVEAGDVAELKAGEASVEVIEKLLRPAEVTEYKLSPTIVGVAEKKTPGGVSKTGDPLLIAASNILLADGTELEVGDRLYVGDTIIFGVMLNAGDTEVILSSEAGEDVVIGVGTLANFAVCTTFCSTNCGSGFFACCINNGGCVFCPCFPNGTQTSCNAGGGAGSSSCSADVAK